MASFVKVTLFVDVPFKNTSAATEIELCEFKVLFVVSKIEI